MKKLLFILFFVPVIACAQVTGLNGTSPRVAYVPGFSSSAGDSMLVKRGGFLVLTPLSSGGSSSLTVGTTPISNSVPGSIFYDSAGVLSRNYAIHWDRANERLSLGAGTSPAAPLTIGATGQAFRLQQLTGSGTASIWQTMVNTGGAFILGLENSAGGNVFAGTSAYSSVFGTTGARGMHFATNNNVRMTLLSGGAVGIGTTSPDTALTINGGIRINNGAAVSGHVWTSTGTDGRGTWAAPSGGGGSGITTLNTLTDATQTFATGTSGTDFGISSSSGTHTFNIPDASASARGLITTGTQTIAGAKTLSGSLTLSGASGNTIVANTNGFVFNATNNRIGLGTASPTHTIHAITDGQIGLFAAASSTASVWNRISNGTGGNYLGVENSAGGNIFTGTLAYASVLGSISNTALQFATNNVSRMTILGTGNVGIRNNAPATTLHVGLAGSVAGDISLGGSTSGTISLLTSAAAGTWNWRWPTTAGSAGQVLTSQAGSSAMTWTTPNGFTDAAVSTTDATPANIATIATLSNEFGVIEVTLVGHRTSGDGHGITGKKVVRYRNVGGTITVGSITSLLADELTGLTTATWTITSSGTNILIQVTGEGSTNIDWTVKYVQTKTVYNP